MNTTVQSTALLQGVKLIGIGKHGSKKLPDELVVNIKEELMLGQSPAILVGAFYGALMMKDTEPSYKVLEEYSGNGSLTQASVLWNNVFSDAPASLMPLGIKLLNKETLTKEEAITIGRFLFSDEKGEAFRGMIVSVLRIRYESDEEYQGMYAAILENAPQAKVVFDKKQIIQLAEPFDGVEHSYMITPVLANKLQGKGYNVLVACGRNSGPKLTLNTFDLYTALDTDFLKPNTNTIEKIPTYGWALDQKVFFPALDRWVDRRRIISKRPFLATLEKVLNPAKADILITSVFHIPYLQKMIELGIMAGFKAVIVLKRGQEGSLAPSLSKATGVLCGVKCEDGTIETKSIDTDDERYSIYKSEFETQIEGLEMQSNVRHIKQYISDGNSGDKEFDDRINIALQLYSEGLEWINQHLK
jgi:anthranilate phosphoribosyltransferase